MSFLLFGGLAVVHKLAEIEREPLVTFSKALGISGLAQGLVSWFFGGVYVFFARRAEKRAAGGVCLPAELLWSQLRKAGQSSTDPSTLVNRIGPFARKRGKVRAVWLGLVGVILPLGVGLWWTVSGNLRVLPGAALVVGFAGVALHWIGHVQAIRLAPVADVVLWPPGAPSIRSNFSAHDADVTVTETSLSVVPRAGAKWLSVARSRRPARRDLDATDFARVLFLEGLVESELAPGSRVLVLANATNVVVIAEEPRRGTGTIGAALAMASVWGAELFDRNGGGIADGTTEPIVSVEVIPQDLVDNAAGNLLQGASRWRRRSPLDALVGAAAKPQTRGVYR